MEIENSQILTDKALSNMKIFCDVARANGASVTLKDLISLTSIELTEQQLSDSWNNYEILASRYRVASGFVLERLTENGYDSSQLVEKTKNAVSENYQRARSNIYCAIQFGSFIGSKTFKVLSISGSTSYLSVSKTDDLDFFCICTSGSMWISFVKSLILARSFRLAQKESPWLCLSYVSDERFAQQEFDKNRDGLFARDAISARVINGEGYYTNLLRQNFWMSEFFPKLYNLRIGKSSETRNDVNRESSFARIVNLFLFYTAGSYIRIKSHILNRKFSRDGKTSSLFRLRIGADHCIYESIDYVRLRKMYAELRT